MHNSVRSPALTLMKHVTDAFSFLVSNCNQITDKKGQSLIPCIQGPWRHVATLLCFTWRPEQPGRPPHNTLPYNQLHWDWVAGWQGQAALETWQCHQSCVGKISASLSPICGILSLFMSQLRFKVTVWKFMKTKGLICFCFLH